MRRVPKQNNTEVSEFFEPQELEDSDIPEFDIEKLLAHGGEILRREISNLMRSSSKGKLDAAGARDLVAYIRLLQELKVEVQTELQNTSDEDLQKLVQK